MTKTQITKLNKKLLELQNTFSLQNWQIVVNFFEVEEELELLGQMEYNCMSLSAIISIKDSLSYQDALETIIHELIHLTLAELNQSTKILLGNDEKLLELLAMQEEFAVLKLEKLCFAALR